MKHPRTKHAINCTLFSLLAGGLATNAMAQEDSVLEEVVVTGIRASVADAIAMKRNSDEIMDAISAEDIGKFPDENIGEALQRIPGVSLDREAGEGKGVSIRGMGAGLSQVTLNGQNMASTEGSREFNFSVLDASMVSALEVWKSPAASQDEGSVGGTVNIVTRGPLDIKGNRFNFSVESPYEELTEDWGSKATANVMMQNDAGTLGFALSANYTSRLTRSDQVVIPGWRVADADSNDWTSRGWDQLAAANGLDHIYYPMDASSRVRLYDRDRMGVNPTVQWQISDRTSLRFDYYYSELEDHDNNQSLQVRIRDLVSGGGRDVNDYNWAFNGNNAVYFDAIGANIRNGWRGYRNIATLRDNTWTSNGANIRLQHDFTDVLTAIVQAGTSDGEGDKLTYPVADFRDAVGFSVDLRDDPRFPQSVIDGGGMDASQLDLWQVNINDQYDKEEQDYLQLDLERIFDGDNLASMEAGFKYHTNATSHRQVRHTGSRDGTDGFTLADFSAICGDAPCAPDNFVYEDDSLPPLNGTFTQVDLDQVLDAFPRDSRASKLFYNESYDVDEETLAAYIQANLEGTMFGIPYRGNAGLRYFKTDLTSAGWLDEDGTIPGEVKRSYDDFLPSLNLVWVLHENVLLRFGGAKVMARPDQDDLALAGTYNFTEETARIGNPFLDPFEAITADLGLEWYFTEVGMLSGGLFYKDIQSFISNGVIDGGVPVDTGDGIEIFDATGPINGDGGTVQGFEFSYQQVFDFLPGFLSGFGTQFNYTYTDSDVDIPYFEGGLTYAMPLEGLSKNSYNFVAFYENDHFSTRVAYNLRDEFLSNRANTQGNPVFTDEYGQWDASINWNINDTFTLSLNAININDEARYQYFLTRDRMLAHRASGRRFTVGLRARF